MFESSGKCVPVSDFRRLVIDLMHFSAAVPSVTVDRRMDLTRLIAARRACTPAPTWSSIFTKAYAVVAARTPLLRTSYMQGPWSKFYEHSTNIASVNIERQLGEENVILYAHIPSPETHSLQEIDALVRYYQQEPLEKIPSYRKAVRMSRVPWPLRRPLWWAALNLLGFVRCQNFGTFGVTSVGSSGAGIMNLVLLLTSQIHYGLFDKSGGLEMRLSFDHRVFDAATAARALADLESVLANEILRECVASACSSIPLSALDLAG